MLKSQIEKMADSDFKETEAKMSLDTNERERELRRAVNEKVVV